MKIGTKTIKETGMQRLRVKDLNFGETAVIRVINGPMKRISQMWPCFAEDKTTATLKATWRSVFVDKDESNALTAFAGVDINLKKKHAVSMNKDPKEIKKSALSKSDRFDYAVIHKKPGEAMVSKILETNWTVHNAIQTLKTAKYPLDPTNLLHYGLPYMYDLAIVKERDVKTKQPKYTVNTMNVHTEGKIKVDYLDEDKFPYPNPEQFFTAEEIEVINATTWDLETIDMPISAADVLAKLREFPIDLGRKDSKNPSVFMFFNSKDDLNALLTATHAQNIPVAIPNEHELLTLNVGSGQEQVNSQPALTNQTALPQSGAVEATYEEVPHQEAVVTPVAQPTAQPVAAEPAKMMAEAVSPVRPQTAAFVGVVQPQPAPVAAPDAVVTPAPASAFVKQDLW